MFNISYFAPPLCFLGMRSHLLYNLTLHLSLIASSSFPSALCVSALGMRCRHGQFQYLLPKVEQNATIIFIHPLRETDGCNQSELYKIKKTAIDNTAATTFGF